MEAAADVTWNGYSLAERDRRWNAVRANAAKAGLDCTFLPLCLDGRNFNLSPEQSRGARSDSRFLTQMECASIVIPTDGREPVVINRSGDGNAWIPNPRPAAGGSMRRSWSDAMARALQDLGMEHARIGVVGLGQGKVTHGRAQQGVVNYMEYAETKRRLPQATFVDATDVVGFARYVKSDEEIDCLRRGAQIAAEGGEEMARVARPGVPEATLYAKVMGRMLSLGSEYYPMALNAGPLDQKTYRHEDPQLGRVLGESWLLQNEIDAVVGQLVAQEKQPILLGPIPERYKPVIDLQRNVFYAGMTYMTPGREFGDFIDYVNHFGDRKGMRTSITLHGRGYGDDAPLLTSRETGATMRDVRVERGNVWVWKPSAQSADGSASFSWGGCVLVTDTGGVQLVQRTPDLLSIQ
ncbi:MAG: M24 family metallopeptidase [Chloroflexi bacterium]|nr:M24 family metallopeptidase [Chloroflexota bacterium]